MFTRPWNIVFKHDLKQNDLKACSNVRKIHAFMERNSGYTKYNQNQLYSETLCANGDVSVMNTSFRKKSTSYTGVGFVAHLGCKWNQMKN